MNILFTSVGRRGYLLEYFRNALGGNGEIHASNSEENAPAFFEADKTVISPLIYADNYIEFILDYCKRENIRAVIPLFDIDVPVLAAAQRQFDVMGVKLVVPKLDVAIMCNDKLKSYEFCLINGFLSPATFSSLSKVYKALERKEIQFPLIIKPRWGMGSIGIYTAENKGELVVFYDVVRRGVGNSYLKYESVMELDEAVLIQEKMVGQEYGLDVVNDLSGNYVTTFVKKKVSMRAGETDAATTINNTDLVEIGSRLGEIVGHLGNLDVDVFGVNGKYYVLELNARFGGGYPFSHIAGANIPKAVVSWLREEPVKKEWLSVEDGVSGYKDINIKAMSCVVE